MRELMLIENPSGKRGKNPVYVAPYSYYKSSARKRVNVPGYVKHFSARRNLRGGNVKNPMGIKTISREWLAGMDIADMGAALGGLASSTMLPGMIVKTTAVELTMGQKLLKAAVAFGAAAGAGFVFRNVSASAGKYAVAAGVAGALAQTIGLFTTLQIGQRRLTSYNAPRRVGESLPTYSSPSRTEEATGIIIP